MKGLTYLLIAGAFVLFSCEQYSTKNENNTARNESLHESMDLRQGKDVLPGNYSADSSTSFVGTYQGVLPCATCKGIEIEIQLFLDSAYVIKTHHQGSNEAPLVNQGKVIFSTDGILTLEGVTYESNMYYLGKDYLKYLDLEGNEITGENADKYILKKVE